MPTYARAPQAHSKAERPDCSCDELARWIMLNALSVKRITRFGIVSVCLCLCDATMFAQHFNRTDLTADMASTSPTAPNVDRDLINPWGLARSSGSPWWVADNGSGLTSLYNAAGARTNSFIVPGLNGSSSAPTGTVFNFSNGFQLANGIKASFIFVTEEGTISAWNGGPSATIMVDRSKDAIYKGAAIALVNGQPYLFATNFKQGTVEVFNPGFLRVLTVRNVPHNL